MTIELSLPTTDPTLHLVLPEKGTVTLCRIAVYYSTGIQLSDHLTNQVLCSASEVSMYGVKGLVRNK